MPLPGTIGKFENNQKSGYWIPILSGVVVPKVIRLDSPDGGTASVCVRVIPLTHNILLFNRIIGYPKTGKKVRRDCAELFSR